VNTLPEDVSDKTLKNNLKMVNEAIIPKCNSKPELSVIDARNLPMKDNIHFTTASIQELAGKVLDSINYSHV
jgi:hypothetical protein